MSMMGPGYGPPVFGRVPTANDPILLNQPQGMKALQRKLETVYPLLSDVDPTVAAALLDLDRQRVARGQQPMSDKQTINATIASIPTPDQQFGRSVIPEQEQGTSLLDVPGNAVGDLRDLFSSIPKLPFLLAKQVTEIPQIPKRLNEAVASGDLQNLQDVPILNLVPGMYTATNVLSGNADEIVKHPLFSALDVLPYAKARVFKAPSNMLDADGAIINRSTYDAAFPKYRRSVGDARNELGYNLAGDTQMVSASDLAKNTKFGRQYQDAVDAARFKFRRSRGGDAFYRRMGGEVREVNTMVQQTQRTMAEAMEPDSALWKDPASSAARELIYKGELNYLEPLVKEWADHNKKFDNDFGVEKYGDAETWAARRKELMEIAEGRSPAGDITKTPVDPATLPAYERDYLRSYRDVQKKYAELESADGLNGLQRPFMRVEYTTPAGEKIKEILPYKQGKDIMQARGKAAAAEEVLFIKQILEDPQFRGQVTPDDVLSRSQQSEILNGNYSKKYQSVVMEGYMHAYLSMGVDARPFLKSITQNRYRPSTPASMLSTAADLQNLLPAVPIGMGELFDSVRPVRGSRRARVHPELDTLSKLIRGNADPLMIRNEFLRVHPRAVADPSVPAEFRNLSAANVKLSLELVDQQNKWLGLKKTSSENNYKFVRKVKGKDLRQFKKEVEDLEQTSVPARFTPKMEMLVRQRMTSEAEAMARGITAGDPAEVARLVDLVSKGEYSRLSELGDMAGTPTSGKAVSKLFDGMVDDVSRSWMDMVDNGFDPTFVHHVAPGRGGKAFYPRVTMRGDTPTSFEARTLDFRPSEGDMALALDHQMMELLVKKGDDHMVDVFKEGSPREGIAPVARLRSEMRELYREQIDRAAARNPNMSYDDVANNILYKDMMEFDASQYKSFKGEKMYDRGGKGRFGKRSPSQKDPLMVPRSVGQMIEDLGNPVKPHAIWDPVMGVFRTTTLLLSPRWQIYNILGNTLNVSMEQGWGWLKHMPDAWKNAELMRKGGQPTANLPWNVRASMGQAAKDQLEYMEISREGLRSAKDFVSEKAPVVADYAERWGKPIGEGVSKVTDFSVRLNAAVDDATRIAGYMAEMDKATKYLTPEVVDRLSKDGLFRTGAGAKDARGMAQQLAEESMRKWSYNWDMLTPWERSVARFVFPFYGFFSHMMRYAYRYTAEHPFRVALTASFARTELEDWGTGLPQRIHNLLIVGKEDEQGNRKAINFAGWNPFVDTANLFTLTGWLSQVNPMISTLAEQFGIDPRTGEASLYPTAEFDEKTGRLVLKKRGIVQSAVQNVVPQSQVVFNLTGNNPEFNTLARTNPGAAARLTGSALGIPTMLRPINVTQEITKTELARENAARQALSQAVRSADLGPVKRYPELQAQVQQLLAARAQNPEQFTQYTPAGAQPSVFDMVKGALTQWSSN